MYLHHSTNGPYICGQIERQYYSSTYSEKRLKLEMPRAHLVTLREMEFTMLLPCTHLRPASTMGNLEESIMNGTCSPRSKQAGVRRPRGFEGRKGDGKGEWGFSVKNFCVLGFEPKPINDKPKNDGGRQVTSRSTKPLYIFHTVKTTQKAPTPKARHLKPSTYVHVYHTVEDCSGSMNTASSRNESGKLMVASSDSGDSAAQCEGVRFLLDWMESEGCRCREVEKTNTK